MASRTLVDSLGWVDQGTRLISASLGRLTEQECAEASTLPGWTRKHLVAHLVGNAEAIGNLMHWATTGEPTPMYSTPEQRNADIEAGAALSGAELARRFDESAATLKAAMDALTDQQWTHEVTTAQGRTVPASETPWMRSREVMVHAVDLGTGVNFSDLPAGFLAALCEDIVGKRSAGQGPALHLQADDAAAQWDLPGDGSPVTVTGSLAAITAYLAGRGADAVAASAGDVPGLPPWL